MLLVAGWVFGSQLFMVTLHGVSGPHIGILRYLSNGFLNFSAYGFSGLFFAEQEFLMKYGYVSLHDLLYIQRAQFR